MGAVGFVLWMGFSKLINMPEDEAADQASRIGQRVVFWTAISMTCLGGLLMMISELRIAVYAFKFQDTVHGILSLLIRVYGPGRSVARCCAVFNGPNQRIASFSPPFNEMNSISAS